MVKLKLMYPLSKVGEGRECGCEDCKSEVLPPCNKRNILYENICIKCNPGAGEKKCKLSPPEDPPLVYVGETARSLYEWGKEHCWRTFRTKQEDSHISKNHQLHDAGVGVPEFHLRPVKYVL